MNIDAADIITFSKDSKGLDFEKETLAKFLIILNQHKDCPYFEAETMRLMKSFVSSVNASQMVPSYLFQIKIGRRRFS